MAIFSTVAMAQNDEKRQAAYDLVSEGVKLYDDGKYEEALKKFNAALKLDDTYASTYYEKALALRAMDKTKEAKKTLEKSLQKCTWGNIAMNYKFLGDITDEEGNARKAIDYYWEALRLADGDSNTQMHTVTYNMGVAYSNLAKQEPDSLVAHRNKAANCFMLSLRFRPTHASSYYGYYSTVASPEDAPADGGYASALGMLGWYGFFGNGHPMIEKMAEMPDKWAAVNLTQAEIDSLGPQTRIAFESVRESAKREPSEYGRLYDMFMYAIPKVAEKFTEEPVPLCMAKDMYEEFLYPLYAKMIREGVFETFCHVAAMRIQRSTIPNMNWIEKNDAAVKKLADMLNEGRYFDPDVRLEQQYGRIPSVSEVTSAEDAHARNEEAKLACKYFLNHYIGTEEMQKTMQFIFSWVSSSPDVTVPLGKTEEKWVAEETWPYLIAYMAACSIELLESGTKELTEDAYLGAVTDMLNFYNHNKEKTGSNAELDRLFEFGVKDFESFEKEIRANFPKKEALQNLKMEK